MTGGAALLAVALPVLIAYNLPPSATFFNQAAAYVGWGLFLLVLSAAMPVRLWPRARGATMVLAALGFLLLAALAAPFWAALPWALVWSNAGTLLAAALVFCVAAQLAATGRSRMAFGAFCAALVVAGVLSAAIGLVQVYAPTWTDGVWISHTTFPGRAVGNMRQPNHLSSLLLWSIIAAIWLGERARIDGARIDAATGAGDTGPARRPSPGWRPAALLVAAALFLFVIVLSASRTGALGMLTLAAWGLLDRRLSRPARVALLLAPLAYAAMWHGAAVWAQHSGSTFVGEARFTSRENISSSRFAIWSNTLEMIRAHPWRGVGFGEYNFAWTLTPFPGRPTEFFDHAHNLILHLAAELGVPLAALVIGLLAGALLIGTRTAVRAGRSAGPPRAPVERAALVIVLLVSVHSLLEYPLWYAYFLLPTVFAFGLCLGREFREPDVLAEAADLHPARRQRTRPLVVASMLLVLGGVLALYDYARVVVIFAPPSGAASLAERIHGGRRSVLFAYHADYALATTAKQPSKVLPAFDRAPHYLLDARLMMAWATALAESGDTERARHLAARLREFGNPQAEAFFAVCNQAAEVSGDVPFQCDPPTRSFGHEDFR